MKKNNYDVLVIGGGCHGLGCAIDAATRGLKVLLLEKNDFFSGTSSKSTKLFHGGVRYLELAFKELDYRQLKFVKESLFERNILLAHNYPLARPLEFLIPVSNRLKELYYKLGILLYENVFWHSSLKKRSKPNPLLKNNFSYIKPSSFSRGVSYSDVFFIDFRFGFLMINKAKEKGVKLKNYCEVKSFEYKSNEILYVIVQDKITNEEFRISANYYIDASGVDAGTLFNKNKICKDKLIKSKGVHLVLNENLCKNGIAMLIPQTSDGRVIFVIPWFGKTLVGTTDTKYSDENGEPRLEQSEISYLIGHINKVFDYPISETSISSYFVGLRSLVNEKKSVTTKSVLREHKITSAFKNLFTIYGGKWTTYRKVSAEVIDRIYSENINSNYGQFVSVCDISSIEIKKKEFNINSKEFKILNDERMLSYYGKFIIYILDYLQKDPNLYTTLHHNYPFLLAEVKYAVEMELGRNIHDILTHRIGLELIDVNACIECCDKVAEILAAYYNWSNEKKNSEVENYKGYLYNKFKLIIKKKES